ncbi:MAG: Regulatory protein AtoC [bacterium]|nr:Regulatory protein AtoC [bacterium]
MPLSRLLIVDDNRQYASSLRRALQEEYAVSTAGDKVEARAAFRKGCDLVLLDLRLDEQEVNNREGLELLHELHQEHRDLPIVMMTAYGDVDIAVLAMKEGAADFLPKPFDLAKLRVTLSNVLDRARQRQVISSLKQDFARIEPGELVGQSVAMENIRRLVQMAAQDGHVTVLIRGETGTGKELVARAIYQKGWRSKEPFVPVVVAALNPNLIESELFGHEAGAFTGAASRRIGYLEKAKGGVLLLDEIGELPSETQVKLLRFLEERSFSRVGSSDSIEVDVQILVATNRNLEEAISEGRIRQDLYFRLKSLDIFLPPLRERLDDIPLLVQHFLDLFCKQGRTKITQISAEAMSALTKYQWPGNVRELKAVLERAVIFANFNNHPSISRDDLPLEILSPSSQQAETAFQVQIGEDGVALDQHLARWELSYIEAALRSTKGRKTEAWKLLGLNDRFALHRRVTALFKKFPHLTSEYPFVQELYTKE